MGIRETIQKNSLAATVVAVIVIAAAVGLAFTSLGPAGDSRPTGHWFYNLESGELFVAQMDAIPPIEAPDGGSAVRVKVFGCGSCSASNRHPAILEKYPDEVAKKLRTPSPFPAGDQRAIRYQEEIDAMTFEALLIANVPSSPGDPISWVAQESDASMNVRKTAEQICGDQEVLLCNP